jgi:hypothetical protein
VARYHLRWKADNSFTQAMQWNGSSWEALSWSFGGMILQSGTYIEWAIPLADIGSPNPVQVHLSMINEADPPNEWTWAAVPATSFVDGEDPDYEDYFAFDRLACTAPSDYMPLPGEPRVWINEIHYDNNSTDQNEGVEIAGSAGTDLTGWSVVAYNGSTGLVVGTYALAGAIPNQQNGMGTLWRAIAGLQNGAPDGVALVDPSGATVQLLSWEGTFLAVAGPAQGLTSVDLGVAEPDTTPVGQSLQLQGTGADASAFVWAGPIAATAGAVNTGQTLQSQ